MTFLRRFWNRLGVKAVPRLCHSGITDSQSGFRLIRKEVSKEVDLSTSRFETELELLFQACKKGFSMISIPINTQKVDGTGSSHFRPVADTWMVCKLFHCEKGFRRVKAHLGIAEVITTIDHLQEEKYGLQKAA